MKYRIFSILIALTGAAIAADGPITGFTALTAPATGDLTYIVDISDTSQSAQGTSKQITLSNLGTMWISDSAFASGWNAQTALVPTQNALYDYLHIFDTDDDGKINLLDNISAAGFPYADTSGLVLGSRTIAEGLAIDVTNGDGASGNPTVAFDPTELTGNRTWSDGSGASIVWTFDLTAGDPAITFGNGIVNVTSGALQVAGAAVLTSGGALGTPSGGTLTNATGLPIAGITGLGTGIGTFLATPTVGNFDAAVQIPCEFIVSCSDMTTALTTGTNKAYFRAPYAFTVTGVRASVNTAPTGAILIMDINEAGTTIMATNKLSIDATESTSQTAATAAGVTDTAIADDAVVSIDIDQVGSTVAGAGLIVTIIGYH